MMSSLTSPIKRLSYPTTQKQDVLLNVARHELLTINQLVYLIYGLTHADSQLAVWQASTRRTVRTLRKQGYLHTMFFRPPGFKGQGKYPTAIWLSEKGREYALEHFPHTDPKSHGAQRSDLNIIHDTLRTDTRIALYEMAERLNLKVACKKTDLFHIVKPDDLYEFTNGKVLHYFLEQERVKKDCQELYEKFLPYVQYHDTRQFKQLWGFRRFHVVVPMRSREAAQSTRLHFAGGCNCIDPKIRTLHAKASFKLDTKLFTFVSHEELLNDPERILDLSSK